MYEYKILVTPEPTANEEQLEGFGNDGWRLVTIVHWEQQWFYYFMRDKIVQ